MKLANEILDSVGVEAGAANDAEMSQEWLEDFGRRLQVEPRTAKPWPTGEGVIAPLCRELGESGGS